LIGNASNVKQVLEFLKRWAMMQVFNGFFRYNQ
jgi:hypothetical protein